MDLFFSIFSQVYLGDFCNSELSRSSSFNASTSPYSDFKINFELDESLSRFPDTSQQSSLGMNTFTNVENGDRKDEFRIQNDDENANDGSQMSVSKTHLQHVGKISQ